MSRDASCFRRSSIELRPATERWARRNDDPGPISLGYRVLAAKDDDQNDYQTIICEKGAWVVHMLRILPVRQENVPRISRPTCR